MDKNNPFPTLTHHAMLVIWGVYARHVGLVETIEAVKMHQKRRVHTPQRKVIEFLVAILAGLPHLQDISRSAHPLDQDQAVAEAWGQESWADYSGVSRTLSSLTMEEAQAVVVALARISQAIIDQEVRLALQQAGVVVYDGDLTGRPVSNTSTTYPNATFGYMSDAIQFGFQAVMVSMHSPTYGRVWLSTSPHPGDTVSSTEVKAMVRAGEQRTGARPRRRTELLQQYLDILQDKYQKAATQLVKAEAQLEIALERRNQTTQVVMVWKSRVRQLTETYRQKQKPEGPYSQLAKARQKLDVYERRLPRREREVGVAERRYQRHRTAVAQWQADKQQLQQHLAQCEADNAHNAAPIRAIFRLDAGFGTPDNIDWLIEMGYEVYSKPHGQWVKPQLTRETDDTTVWSSVGRNAEMTAWSNKCLSPGSYPLNAALVRFHTGQSVRTSALLHYGQDPVTSNLAGWFGTYNQRQTIEAGIKEGKGIFQMHHLKVRAEPALYIQEHFAAFAANFVRFAAHWLQTQNQKRLGDQPASANIFTKSVKQLVQVAAHTSAWVFWKGKDCLLRFSEQSLYAGTTILVGDWPIQPPLPFLESADFQHF